MRSKAEIEAENQRVLAVECRHCGAKPGRWCRDFSDRAASRLHVKRMRAAGVDIPKARVR